VKIRGQRAYHNARKGKETEIPERTVFVHSIQLIHFKPAMAGAPASCMVDMECSKGTYVRSIAHDLGQLLGTGAWLSDLRRTAIGDFRVENAWRIDEFSEQLKSSELLP
jgi:tRNA pseudouridine55 synthase